MDWITCTLRRLHGQVQVGLASKTEGRITVSAAGVLSSLISPCKTEADLSLQSSFLFFCHQECAGFQLKLSYSDRLWCLVCSILNLWNNPQSAKSPNPLLSSAIYNTQYKWHYCKPARSFCCANPSRSVISGWSQDVICHSPLHNPW